MLVSDAEGVMDMDDAPVGEVVPDADVVIVKLIVGECDGVKDGVDEYVGVTDCDDPNDGVTENVEDTVAVPEGETDTDEVIVPEALEEEEELTVADTVVDAVKVIVPDTDELPVMVVDVLTEAETV